MAAAMDSLSQEYESWLRLAILIDFSGRKLCHNVLFVQEQLPTDGRLLYEELKTLKCQYRDQREILCPSSGITDCDKFDVTLCTNAIKQKFGNKYDSLVTDVRNARNKLFHTGKKEIPDIEFDQLWKDTTDMLQKHHFDLALVDGLKTCDIFSHQQFRSFATFFHQGNIGRFWLLLNLVYSFCFIFFLKNVGVKQTLNFTTKGRRRLKVRNQVGLQRSLILITLNAVKRFSDFLI